MPDLTRPWHHRKSRRWVEISDGSPARYTRNKKVGVLLQRAVDRGELGVQVGTEAVDHGDDREGDAGGDQSVFDGSGSGLVMQETRKELGHRVTPGDAKARSWQPGIATTLNELLKSHRKIRLFLEADVVHGQTSGVG